MHENNTCVLLNITITELAPHIDWNFFFAQWDLGGRYPAIFDHPERGKTARTLFNDAKKVLSQMSVRANAAYHIMKAERHIDDILLSTCDCCPSKIRFPMLRNQTTHFKSLVDYVTEQYNHVTPFALCVHNDTMIDDGYNGLMSQILCDRLADALSTYITLKVEQSLNTKTLPMAFGYPAVPDHSPKRLVFNILEAEKQLDMTLTQNYSMAPTSSVCGIMISHPEVEYFSIGYIGDDQVADYSARAGLTTEQLRKLIPNNLLPLHHNENI